MPYIDLSDEHVTMLRAALFACHRGLSTAGERIMLARVQELVRRIVATYLQDPRACEIVFEHVYDTDLMDFTGWPQVVEEDVDPWDDVEPGPDEREAIQREPRSCWSWIRAPTI